MEEGPDRMGGVLGVVGELDGRRIALHLRRNAGPAGALGGTGPDTMGDWERILGPEHFDKLYLTDRLSADVRHAGLAVWFIAMAIVLFGIAWNSDWLKRTTSTLRARTKPAIQVSQENVWK